MANGLQKSASFLRILRSTKFTYPVTKQFLDSQTVNLINPRHHKYVTDQVSLHIPASAVSGLKDEAVLAAFTKGFFTGPIFAIERFILKAGGWRLLPARYTGFKSKATERIIWNYSEILPATFMPVGDVLFGSFKLMDAHLTSLSDPYPSYLDFGFGSDLAPFAGCHRFSLHRSRDPEEQIEIRLEHFRCNPKTNVDSWAEYITWFHNWYARLLFTDGIRSCLAERETSKIK